jgi:hypothetical protein
MKTTWLFLLFFVGLINTIFTCEAQQVKHLGSDTAKAIMLTAAYAFQLPGADMHKRFGYNGNVGSGVWYKTKQNYLLGLDACFLFGNTINEDSIAYNVSTNEGWIIGNDGYPANLNFFERGFMTTAKVGKLFVLNPKQPNAGIVTMLGLGYMQHKIKIEDKNEVAYQFINDYVKGYDRLTSGLMLSQFIGYMYLDKRKRINFYIGAEFVQGFTKAQRQLNFDTFTNDTNYQRKDLLYGLKVGWILPLYTKSDEASYYYN